MSHTSRWTPIVPPRFDGYQVIPGGGGGAALLSTVLPFGLPPEANGAWIQVALGGALRYSLQGVVMPVNELGEFGTGRLVLTNREQIEMCVIGLEAGDVLVQFFTGRIGTTG